MVANIQALRALAATLVIFVHLDYILAVLGVRSFGYGGVDLFFVISGYIMVYSTRAYQNGPAHFLVHRLVRVAPLYWILTLIVFLLAREAPRLLGTPTGGWRELAKSLLFIPFKRVDGRFEPVFFLGWTLNLEMFFYAVFALSLLSPSRRWGVIGIIGLLFALPVIGLYARPASGVLQFYTSPIVGDFGLGCIVGSLQVRRASRRQFAPAVILAALAIVVIALSGALFASLPRLLSAGLPAAVLVYIAVKMEVSGLRIRNRLVLSAGNASYSLYLTHPYVTVLAKKALGHAHIGSLTAALMAPVVISGCVGLSLIAYRWLEKPLTASLRRVVDQRLFPTVRKAALPDPPGVQPAGERT